MSTQHSLEEEPWEHEIQRLLGSLPPIEPPEGFLVRALNHRPLFAGRVGVGLGVLAVGSLAACLAAGWFAPRQVVPELASMTQQHEMSVANLFGGLTNQTLPIFEPIDAAEPTTSVTLPDTWDHAGNYEEADIQQVLYAEGDAAVSVFSEPGLVAWDEMSESGRTTLKGIPAWVDPVNKIVVIQAADSVVTVVGLDADEVVVILEGLSADGRGFWDTALDVANGLATSVGFPDS